MATRYLSAEGMSADDFGIPFTMQEGEVVYDAKLAVGGQWATMTQKSWRSYGCGMLGIGCGQKYVRRANGELHKVEG